MAKKNYDAAVLAAIAVAAVVTLSTEEKSTSSSLKPTTESTVTVSRPTHVPIESLLPTEETTAPTILYDVPLDASLQLHIIHVAESYNIDPAIIFALIYRESSYNPASIGDYGDSFGLMQVQPKWHSDRMARLGCSDLLDPYQNVIVGADFLAEQLARYGGDISKALVAYNAGHYNGTITQYAQEILAKAEELRGTTYEASEQSI